MKSRLFAGALLFILGTLSGCATLSPAPQQLRCEYLKNPMGMDTAHPRLAWIDADTHRDQRQTAYQVVVSSAGATLWNSGKIASDDSSQIVYGGRPLQAWEQATWRVRTWDERNRASRWSAPASWEAGMRNATWQARWIAGDTGLRAPMLRKDFVLQGQVKRARAFVSGVGYFQLHLNGKVISHRLDPGFTDFDKRVLYCTFDVTNDLQAGANAVGLVLGTGWFDVHERNVWDWDKAPWHGIPRAIIEIRAEMADGSTRIIGSDGSWKYSTGPWTCDNIYGGADYDARLEKPGWDRPGYADADWDNAKIIDGPKGKLVSRQMPPICVTERFKPVKITEPTPGVYLVDLGQNIAGVPELHVAGPAGTRITLECGERLASNGLLDQSKIDGLIKNFGKDQPFQEDHYTLKGQGIETWSPRFTYHGFQYVQVTGFPGKLTGANICGLAFHTDIPCAGSFACSNPLLNKIQSANRWSFVNNLQSIETDCPTREKNGWTGDADLAAESAMFNYMPAAFYTKWTNDISDAQKPDGNLPGIVPSGGWGYGTGIGPAWDSICILLPWQVYEYYGDRRILAAHYETMQRYMDYLHRLQKNGIITTGIGDWAPYKAITSNALTSTGYYYRDAVAMSDIADLLGKSADAKKYRDLALAEKSAINARFFDAAKNSYAEGSQTDLACALYQGFAPKNHRAAVLANLVALIEKDHRHLDCGILGAKYVMNVLIENGREDLAYAIMNQHDMPSWGYWIDHGATTLWESWGDHDSRDHVMFGDVSACMFKSPGGIRREATGFSRVSIRPAIVGDLTWARACYESVHGKIESNWKVDGATLTMDVTLPTGVRAEIYVPTSDPGSAVESGGARPSRRDVAAAVFSVGSGHYHFTAKR